MRGEALTHVDESGAARMVDVTAKQVSVRTGRASGRVRVSARVVELLRGAGMPKGDALATARIAGIMAAKRTPDLVPLCHPIAIHGVTVDLVVEDDAVAISATVRTADRTGVEMEALTAVSVAALTVVDMVKAVDPGAVITDVRVEEKTGGVSGDWSRDAEGRVAPAADTPADRQADQADQRADRQADQRQAASHDRLHDGLHDNGDTNGDTNGAAAGESPPAPVPGDGGQDR